jgi:hypothetical protein
VAKRNSGRRGRQRKRRQGAPSAAGGATATADANEPTDVESAASHVTGPEATSSPAGAASAGAARRQRGARRPPAERGIHRDPGGVGERPQAPWHPWPLSELLILVGAIGTVVGFSTRAVAPLVAGLASVLIGTLDFTIREHLSGYRSHGALIAAVPTAIFHGAVAFVLFEAGAPRASWIVVPIALDVPLFWFLFRALRARFEDARRERVFALRRR